MPDSETLAAAKAALRDAAAQRRAAAHAALGPDAATGQLAAVLAEYPGAVVSGYLPMRSEISPLAALAGHDGALCMPVVQGRGLPLRFRAWAPGAATVRGSFGAEIPADGAWLEPAVLVVPLLAFDARGYRLGYGGGFYDRTLAGLRATGRGVRAIGLAYAAQAVASLPVGAFDQPLDLVVTETGPVMPRR